jgi:exopolyphosphatase/guanosine-5'-triphosphate,3'-diphosphate pyrophosphatase
VPRSLTLDGLDRIVHHLQPLTADERAELPGVSPNRAQQLLAGAVVAQESMRVLDLEAVSICPWALREGVILRRLDWLAGT